MACASSTTTAPKGSCASTPATAWKYLDPWTSRAFDHQVAHLYVSGSADVPAVAKPAPSH
ncbi:hypothetical protein AB0K16_57165 [Nonomuraea jabiensis]|uniref:hypothetical protein n=1 Tax=Nonomuraea jabiensis TaxID=882448 RepID=UPI0034258FB0